MLRFSLAAVVALTGLSAFAQEVSEEAYDLIDCGVTFLVHSDVSREGGDTATADTFGTRGEALVGRGAEMLVADGLDSAGIEDVLANLTLRASFLYPGDGPALIAACEAKGL